MRTDVTSSGGAQCSRRNPSGIHFTKFLSVARHALAMLEGVAEQGDSNVLYLKVTFDNFFNGLANI